MFIRSTRALCLSVLSLGLLLAPAARAQGNGNAPAASAPAGAKWEKLGERTVDAKLDHDSINVGREDGVFDAIQINVDKSAIALVDIKVTFGNGEVFSPNTKLVFDKNTSSRVIDLPGAKRGIKKIDLKYADLPAGGKAKVEIMGRAVAAGWDKLGGRDVDAKADHDAIAVTSDDGNFTAIQLKVDNGSLAMSDIKITFANGETFSPNTKLVFDKNSSTRVIDLPGNRRAIRKIEFKYADLPGGGKARVEVFGRH